MPFNPTFTYPIFGEKEKIYGYKNLQIEVSIVVSSWKIYIWERY